MLLPGWLSRDELRPKFPAVSCRAIHQHIAAECLSAHSPSHVRYRGFQEAYINSSHTATRRTSETRCLTGYHAWRKGWFHCGDRNTDVIPLFLKEANKSLREPKRFQCVFYIREASFSVAKDILVSTPVAEHLFVQVSSAQGSHNSREASGRGSHQLQHKNKMSARRRKESISVDVHIQRIHDVPAPRGVRSTYWVLSESQEGGESHLQLLLKEIDGLARSTDCV
ncbi:hypothetical protein RRG08_048471 [Elysia crispata]|uniref:Uncharacterized protein n=1 Tax=Elysia crispata TaxID=231223 RepID=A0AAE1EBY7_9GAST|nr:hypothetical protein RRG08_048471 [Elysia crispata]